MQLEPKNFERDRETGGDPTDDARLAAASQRGSEAAFTTLVERYHSLIFRIALHKCGHRTDAEDLTQEIFLHAFRSLPRLRDPQAFVSWLVAIAHNRAHRFFRSRRAKVIALEEARRELQRRHEQQAKGDPDPGGLGELVSTLPDEYRWALTWKYLEGVSYEEIGERLSLSFHQVDYLLRRAKRALRHATRTGSNRRRG